MIDRIRKVVRLLLATDHGATAVEYAIMVGFIAVVIAGAAAAVGFAVRDLILPVIPGLGG